MNKSQQQIRVNRMEYSVSLIIGAVIIIIIINYIFAEDTDRRRAATANGIPVRTRRLTPSQITTEMIERVREIAPGLSDVQIRDELMYSGSVGVTVDRYLSGLIVIEEDESNDHTDKKSYDAGNSKCTNSTTFQGLNYEEMKEKLIIENRRKFLEKHPVLQ